MGGNLVKQFFPNLDFDFNDILKFLSVVSIEGVCISTGKLIGTAAGKKAAAKVIADYTLQYYSKHAMTEAMSVGAKAIMETAAQAALAEAEFFWLMCGVGAGIAILLAICIGLALYYYHQNKKQQQQQQLERGHGQACQQQYQQRAGGQDRNGNVKQD